MNKFQLSFVFFLLSLGVLVVSCGGKERQYGRNLSGQVEMERAVGTSDEGICGALRKLDSLVCHNDYSDLKFYGHALDDVNGRIIIMLGDVSEENITQFKEKVMDVPYLRFEEAKPVVFE